jgi:hypothetical protein
MQPRLKVEKHCCVLMSTELIILFTDLMMDHMRKLQPSVMNRACKRYSLQCREICLQQMQHRLVPRCMLAKDSAYSVTKYAGKR